MAEQYTTALLVVVYRDLHEFGDKVSTELKGLPGDVSMTSVSGGARLNQLFYNEFVNTLALVGGFLMTLHAVRMVT